MQIQGFIWVREKWNQNVNCSDQNIRNKKAEIVLGFTEYVWELRMTASSVNSVYYIYSVFFHHKKRFAWSSQSKAFKRASVISMEETKACA